MPRVAKGAILKRSRNLAIIISPQRAGIAIYRGFGRSIISLDMLPIFLRLRWIVFGLAFIQCATILHSDECVKFHNRAPLKAVCGHVTNAAGERLHAVKLTLAGEAGAELFTATSDNQGRFSFGPIPKGDYLLRANGPSGYSEVRREIRVTENNAKRCSPKIEISLGPGSCSSGTRTKGVDKPSDLESEPVR